MPKIAYVHRRNVQRTTRSLVRSANEIIAEYENQGFCLTLRQLYYQFVARDLVPNTQQSYKRVGTIINNARLQGEIDWLAIEDRTRNLCANSHWDSPHEIVESCAAQFKVDLWLGQSEYCEVWIEKEALVGVISDVCERFDVPYFACRGYVSQSKMWRAARRLCTHEGNGRRTIIFHLGDHDPSGIDMTRDVRDRLKMFDSVVEVHRIAFNMDQVSKYNPPPNPAKTTDARYRSYSDEYGEDSWELDALEPRVIVKLIEDSVSGKIDFIERGIQEKRQIEAREQLQMVANRWDDITFDLEG